MTEQTSQLKSQIEETLCIIKKHTKIQPETAIILGTGLGGLAKEIEKECVIPYEELPHFPLSTVETHAGRLIFGTLSGKKVLAMEGRFHFYEGYSFTQITYPVRVMKALGVKNLIIASAGGSMNPYYKKSEIMLIDDYVNLLGGNPLIGPNDNRLGLRFPDMSEPYSKELMSIAENVATANGIRVHKGVYVAMTGPCLETRAEYRFLRSIGADVVGMSTVPETIVARHADMNVLGMTIITDECYPDSLKKCDISEIIEAANKAEPQLITIVKGVLEKI